MSETANVIEYSHDYLPKAEWGRGEWNNEPDKVQYVDVATNLDCLILRGPVGALCGYVGVPETHPLFGTNYSGCAADPKCEESYCEHSPDRYLRVHGGLTFSDACHEPTREGWERWREMVRASAAEVAQYPNGSAARRLRDHGHLIDDFEGWRQWGISAFICHVPAEGRPERVWWFGFDCAHYGDLCPGMNRYGGESGYYKNRRYVESEIASLAQQLADIQPSAAA
jgi:hypothetical protein